MKLFCDISVVLGLFFLLIGCEKTSSDDGFKLPVIHIYSSSQLNFEGYQTAFIAYKSVGFNVFSAQLKCRGGWSSHFDKHSYSIRLDSAFSFIPSDENTKWILNANYIDKTFMRHKISYDLFREMNESNNSPESAYVIVYLNAEYHGLYLMMQRLNEQRLSIDQSDALSFIAKEPSVFRNRELMEIDMKSIKYAADKEGVFNYLNEFKRFLLFSSDEQFQQAIEDYLDLESVIDWQLLLQFSNNSDGVLKNFYIYKQDASTPMKMAPWDYDHSFGRDGDNELNMSTVNIALERSILFERLMNWPSYTSRLASRWNALREDSLFSQSNFEKYIELNDNIIRNEIRANRAIWPDTASWYFDSNTYEMELDTMRKYVSLNIEALDSYFNLLKNK